LKTTSILTHLLRLPFAILLMFRSIFLQVCLKRWYVLRNTPDWFVQMMATMPDDGSSDDATAFGHEAKAEWKLRKRQRNLKRR